MELGGKERECNCCIEVEDSIVVIICGEVEIEKFKKCIETIMDEKGKKTFGYMPKHCQ